MGEFIMKYLIQAIDDYLEKCSLTLKSVRKQLRPVLNELFEDDSNIDIDEVLEDITRFYVNYYNAENENLYLKGYDGTEWTNEGTRKQVMIPMNAKQEGMSNGLLLSIHNHPEGCAYPSGADYKNQAEMNEYINVVCSNDGILISKNPERGLSPTKVSRVANKYYKENVLGPIEKTGEYENIVKDYNNGKLPISMANEMLDKHVKEYINNNLTNIAIDSTIMFHSKKIPFNVRYKKIKKGL